MMNRWLANLEDLNFPGAKVSVINKYLIKKRDSDFNTEDDFIKGKFMGNNVEGGPIKL